MKKWFPLVVGSVLISTATHSPARDLGIEVDTKRSALDAANQAADLYKKGDFEGARHLYDVAIRDDPRLYLALYFRGRDFDATTQVGVGGAGL